MFGSLLGLGGGVLIVPLLTLGFGLPLREAVGVSLVCVIMTSSAAAGVYLERHVANLRLGHDPRAVHRDRRARRRRDRVPPRRAASSRCCSRGPARYVAVTMLVGGRDAAGRRRDADRRDRADEPTTMSIACRVRATGCIGSGSGSSGRPARASSRRSFGIGGGIIKVPLMHLGMGVPLRVATATSNLMIGITAAASAVIYLVRGEIDPYVAGPTAIGVFLGRDARVADRAIASTSRYLRLLFVVVLVYTAIQMLLRGDRMSATIRTTARPSARRAPIGRLLIAMTYVVGRPPGRRRRA